MAYRKKKQTKKLENEEMEQIKDSETSLLSPEESEQIEEEQQKKNIEETKFLLNIEGEYRYHLLTILNQVNQNLVEVNQNLKGIGLALNNIGEVLEEESSEDNE